VVHSKARKSGIKASGLADFISTIELEDEFAFG
jgi:hypothetical protein